MLDHAVAGEKSGKHKGTMRLSMWPNANFIRYTMAHDLKEPGSVQFTRLIEVGLTRDGESLAGAAVGSEPPKCIVTGGAATMTMSYQGRTFPICCTGCRDEFNENPEKYIKKASLMAGPGRQSPNPARPPQPGVSRFEDAFANDVVESPSSAKPASEGSSKTNDEGRAGHRFQARDQDSTTKTSSTKDDDRAAARQASQPGGLASEAWTEPRKGR